MELFAKIVYDPVLKNTRTELSAHMRKITSALNAAVIFFTTIFLGDRDFPLTGSNFGNLTACNVSAAIVL